jgi:hypothetical protein
MEPLDYPNTNYLVSSVSEGFVNDSLYSLSGISSRDIALTFNNLIKQTGFVKILGDILSRLESTWGQPVDIEFTAAIDENEAVKVNLLQCRPLRLPRIPDSPVTLPEKLDSKHVLFKADRIISGGTVDSIKYVIYIDHDKYAAISSLSRKRKLGRIVGKINEYFRGKHEKIMAIGPGRWGSNNIDLGVNVSYADIDNFMVLVEVGRAGTGSEPELSYGTHFFQDLVEADIIYMPVFPDNQATEFNNRFFMESPNALIKITPEYADFKDIIKVIDVPSEHNGAYVNVIADARTRKAVCYLK